MANVFEQLQNATVYDLGQPYFTGMPHFPTHPPFLFSLTKQHGDSVGPTGHSSAADAIALGSHVGTHIDALSHFSCDGKLHGGVPVEGQQSYGGGVRQYSVDTIAPILRRGVLLDLGKGGPLPADHEIMPDELAEAARDVEIRRGDIVVLRTGRAVRYADTRAFVNGTRLPGPGLAGGPWGEVAGVSGHGGGICAYLKITVAPLTSSHVVLVQ